MHRNKIKNNRIGNLHSRDKRVAAKNFIIPHKKTSVNKRRFQCCRGRDRTSTEQLVVAQSWVVDPGRINIAIETALCYIYPVTSTPETRGHVCQKFHHPTISKFKSCIRFPICFTKIGNIIIGYTIFNKK